jgi:hypothetical protein
MSKTAFASCCYQGKICKHGYYYDNDGNEVELKRRPTEAITIQDEQGIVRTFNSKSDAAEHYNVSNKVISMAIKNCKNGELPTINTKNNEKNRKLLTLQCGNEVLEFASLTVAAKELNTNKMAVSRAIKGKEHGDLVTINGNTYTLITR